MIDLLPYCEWKGGLVEMQELNHTGSDSNSYVAGFGFIFKI